MAPIEVFVNILLDKHLTHFPSYFHFVPMPQKFGFVVENKFSTITEKLPATGALGKPRHWCPTSFAALHQVKCIMRWFSTRHRCYCMTRPPLASLQ